MSPADAIPIDAESSVQGQKPPAGWIAAATAAPLLGIAARTVQLRCQRGEYTARLIGGAWWIDPASEAALRLAVGDVTPGPAVAGDGLAALSETQRQRVYDRLEMLNSYQAAMEHKPGNMSMQRFSTRWCETWNLLGDRSDRSDHRKIGRTALYNWLSAYRKHGVMGLSDRRGGARTPADFDGEAQEYFLGLYLKETKPSIPYIYQLVAGEARVQGWRIPKLRTVQAWLKKRIDPKMINAARDPKKFRDRNVPYITRDWTKVPPMGCWIADHRILDIFVPRRKTRKENGREVTKVVFERPWLTCWLDARTWLPVSWIIDFDSPNAQRVASAFVAAVEQHGCPQNVYLDNGKDFRAAAVAGGRPNKKKRKSTTRAKLFDEKRAVSLMEALGVTVHWARPYNAKAKTIEPWFKIVAAQFDRAWPTYLGNCPDNRPEQLKGLRADRVDPKFDLAAVRSAFDDWVNNDYALQTPSPAVAAGGLSALRAFNELRPAGFRPARPSAGELSLLLMRGRRTRVEANGVWAHAFSSYYWSDELENRRCASGRDLARHVVIRYVDGDPRRVYVFDAKTDRFLCVATPYVANGLHPLATPGSADAEQISDALALQSRLAKKTNQQVRDLRQGAKNVLIEAHRRSGEQLGILDDPQSTKTPAPPQIRLVGRGDMARAAAAGEQHEAQRQQLESQRLSLASATGTDDTREAPSGRQAATIFDPWAGLSDRQDNRDPSTLEEVEHDTTDDRSEQ